MKDSTLLLLGLALGTLVIGGAAAGVMLLRKPAPVAGGTPAPAGGLVVGNGVTVPVGSGTSGWSVQQALAQQQAQDAQWRRTDAINTLERDLATCQNEIKRLTDQLNVIDATPMPADIITRWSLQHKTDCENSRLFGWGCDKYADLSDGYQAKADAEWAARKQDLKRPILTRLSELNSQQLSLIQNLRDLGVPKTPVTVRTA